MHPLSGKVTARKIISQTGDKGGGTTENDSTYIDYGMEESNIHITKRAEAEQEAGDLKKDKGNIYTLPTSAWRLRKNESISTGETQSSKRLCSKRDYCDPSRRNDINT